MDTIRFFFFWSFVFKSFLSTLLTVLLFIYTGLMSGNIAKNPFSPVVIYNLLMQIFSVKKTSMISGAFVQINNSLGMESRKQIIRVTTEAYSF